jgi:MSHA biogenesis protein MshQ
MWLLMAAGLGMPAAALGANACSASVGKVNLNEYNYIDNFTEVKKLDAGVDMTGWKVTVYTSNKTTSGALPASGANSCFGGVYQVNQFGASQTSQNADIVLFDANDDVVDILRVRTANTPFTTTYYPSAIPACGFVSAPYDLQVSAANKGVDRTPDGSGPWRNTPGTGANSFSTECGGNAPGAAPGSFNAFETATAVGATSGVIKTKIAGSAFGLDVVAIGGGAQESTFSDAVKIELLGNATTGVGLDANNCPTSFTLLQTIASANIANGRSSVGFAAVGNAWRDVRVRISYPAGSPTSTSCSTDNFAIRPAGFGSVAVSDTDSAVAGTARTLDNIAASGGVVHKAGRPFRIAATAYNAAGVATPNYTGNPASSLAACVLPVSGCTLGALSTGIWSTVSGTVTTDGASYSEVGAFVMKLADAGFAAVDVDDSSAAEMTIESADVNVGRFVPDHFELTTASSPVFKTFNDTTCATRSFTYVGQPFGYLTLPEATITAKNAAGATTTNYAGALWKLAPAGVMQTYAAVTGTVDDGLLGTPAVAAAGGGVGSLIANAADVIAFERPNPVPPLTPPAPFSADITLTMSIQDAAENGVPGNGIIDTAMPAEFSSILFDSGNDIRFGRLILSNAHGSELLDLPVPIETQYWNGSGFARNTADFCTQLAAANVALSGWKRDLNACETSVELSGRFSAGQGKLRLTKPAIANVGNTGSVNLTLQLGATASDSTCVAGVPAAAVAASQIWLQGRWTGGDYDQNPAARASFGLYRGSKSLIYLREMY